MFRTHVDSGDQQPEREPAGLLDWADQDQLIALFGLRARTRSRPAGCLSRAEVRRVTFWRAMFVAGRIQR